jgi:hypothetical protein
MWADEHNLSTTRELHVRHGSPPKRLYQLTETDPTDW